MKTLVRTALASAVIAAASLPAQGQMFLTGADFLNACTRPDQAWISFCDGYVQAIYDAFGDGVLGGERVCLPQGTTRNELVYLTLAVLGTAPALLAEPAAVVVYAAMATAYPCR